MNENGGRIPAFNESWAAEFSDKIKSEANGKQFVALRARTKENSIKGGFETLRYSLEKWLDFSMWRTEKIKETKMNSRLSSITVISIEAQRDIHQELKDKASFVGKVLSSIVYPPADVAELESSIKSLNDQAVESSAELKKLKMHLEQLNRSFQGAGNAEIMPFPKKIRDLSKHFSVHLGDSSGNAYSMEYHGMGTRSWASMLTVKAFAELMEAKHELEETAYFSIVTAEEPEAHLHPNAQKTIYHQLATAKGQVIISTHSPYVAAMAKQSELRYLKNDDGESVVRFLSTELDLEDARKIQREVIHSRGEIIFSKAWVLCEGETEEQALPMLFRKYFSNEAFALGIDFIGVGGSGKKYLPFLKFAKDFSIPVFVFSDGEEKTIKDLKKHYESVFGATDVSDCPNITLLEKTNFEGYLLSSGFKNVIEEAIRLADGTTAIEDWINHRHLTSKGRIKTGKPACTLCKQPIYEDVFRDYKSSGGYEQAMFDLLGDCKPRYAPIIAEKLCELEITKFPPKVIEFFEKIKGGVNI